MCVALGEGVLETNKQKNLGSNGNELKQDRFGLVSVCFGTEAKQTKDTLGSPSPICRSVCIPDRFSA